MTILVLFIIVLAAILAAYFYYDRSRKEIRERLQLVVDKRRIEIRQNIEDARKSAERVYPAVRDYIASLDFEKLKGDLQSGKISCLDTVLTYFHKAVIANEKTNAICMFIKEAEQWASEWDQKAKQIGFLKPPLFGIPISIKECLKVRGYDQTRGFVQHVYHPASQDEIHIKHLKNLGAIPFCITNVPQALLSYDCSNPVYGTTIHPLDGRRTSGGSSGGEAALLGAGGSILGLGNDVGGSIRIPCHFTGTVGMKPAKMRFAHRLSIPGKPMIDGNEGPMARDVTSLVEYLRSVWGDDFQSEQDPYCPPVRWNEDAFASQKKLRIGYYVDDGWFTPTPAIQRAVLEAKDHLERAGHTVVPFKVQSMTKAMQLYYRAVCLDGGQYILRKLLKDLIEPTIAPQIVLWMVPVWLKILISYPLMYIFPRMAILMRSLTRDTFVLRDCYTEISEYRERFFEQMLEDQLDVLICPPQIIPAPQHDVPSKLVSGISYTCLFNLLDYAAGVVPVTTVNKQDEEKLITEYPETDQWYRLAKKSTIGAVGMPVGVQVAAPPYREEVVLRVMKIIEAAAKES